MKTVELIKLFVYVLQRLRTVCVLYALSLFDVCFSTVYQYADDIGLCQQMIFCTSSTFLFHLVMFLSFVFSA
jgi:hypothetical protein